jgi:hypothetical protein
VQRVESVAESVFVELDRKRFFFFFHALITSQLSDIPWGQ